MRVDEVLQDYKAKYKALIVNRSTINVTSVLWNKWEQDGVKPLDFDSTANYMSEFDKEFFNDIVKYSNSINKEETRIAYCAYCLNNYNFSIYTAEDGHIIFIDENFLTILFFIIVVIVYHSLEMMAVDEVEDGIKSISEYIELGYFNRNQIFLNKGDLVWRLLERDYEISEYCNYLFLSIKAFIFSHEVGHVVLGHTTGKEKQIRLLAKEIGVQEITIDNISIKEEFEADKYGYKLFDYIQETPKKEMKYAFLKYKHRYAPLVFFEICNALDSLWEKRWNRKIVYETHPKPIMRIDKLIQDHSIEINGEMYADIIKSLKLFLKTK